MDAYKSFVAEVVMLSLLPVLFVSRFWILRHQTRALEDWIRDIFFAVAILMCMATTSILAWYCWRSINVYKQAAAIVDQKMEGAVTSSGVDTSRMTMAQLSAFVEKIQAERASKIEGLATMMLLDSWYRRILFVIWFFYVTELWLLKGAFLAFYWRLFSRVQARVVYLLYAATAYCIITYIIVITIHFTWCTPVHRNWTMPLEEFPQKSSINSLVTLTIGSFLNITTDLVILILPLLTIQSFNLRRREKLGLCFIFLVGIMSVAASVVRYVVMYLPFRYPPATMQGVRISFLWSTLEVLTGFIAFCLPSFRVFLFKAFCKEGKSSTSGRSRQKHHDEGYSSEGYSDPKNRSLPERPGGKPKRKNLPRHPNSLLSADFVALDSLRSMDEEAALVEQHLTVNPSIAIPRDTSESLQTQAPADSSEERSIQVTRTFSISTSLAGPLDSRSSLH